MLFLVALLPLVTIAQAATHSPPHLRHRRIAQDLVKDDLVHTAQVARANTGHAEAHKVIKRIVKTRGQQCRLRPNASLTTEVASPTSINAQNVVANGKSSTTSSSTTSSSSQTPAPTDSGSNVNNGNNGNNGNTGNNGNNGNNGNSGNNGNNGNNGNSGNNGNNGVDGSTSGILSYNDNTCGWCNSSPDSPNGSQDWLNCGLTGGGWTPPHVGMSDLIAAELSASGTFAPCAAYIDKFNQYAREFNVHPIMAASFAMQESTCNPWATGGNGEAGLMQITPANCNNPSGDCYDVDYNIRRGVELFSQMISHNGGNVLAAVGSYNGWRVGMTKDDATRAKSQGHCFQQNNLDYLDQFFNGWMQGKNGYALGTYFNLNGC